MTQAQTGVDSKTTGDEYSGAEFTSVNSTINNNADDAETRLVGKLGLAGGTMTGNISMQGNEIQQPYLANMVQIGDNLKYIDDVSQFPAASSGVITVTETGVTYVLTALINLGADRIVFTGANVFVVGVGSQSGFTSTNAGTIITITTSIQVKLMNIIGMSATKLIDATDAGTHSTVFESLGLVGGAATTCVAVSDYANCLIDLCGFVSGLSGISVSSSMTNFTISNCQFQEGITGKQIDYDSATCQSTRIAGCASTLSATSTFLTIATDSGNITATGNGVVIGNSVDNALGGTKSVGADPLDARWIYIANDGVTGSDRLEPTGWGFYVDDNTGGAVNIPALEANAVVFTVNALGGTTETGFLPRVIRGIGDLWDSTDSEIVPITEGDSYDFRISFDITGKTGNPALLTLVLDISGGVTIVTPIAEDTKTITTSTSQKILFTFPFFTLSTFINNHGKFLLYTDVGSVDIEERKILIERVSSGVT